MENKGNYVGFGRRFVAALLDGLILFVISILLSAIRLSPLTIIADVGYYVYFWSQKNGQTLGARALGFRVVKESGGAIDIGTGIIRYIGYIVSIVPIGLGFFWVIWDKKKQGWHDKIAQTVVVPAK